MIVFALPGIELGWALALTYLLHGTLWVLAAALLTWRQRTLAPAARHLVWRAAAFGPLASSPLSLALARAWRWACSEADVGEPTVAHPPWGTVELRPLELGPLPQAPLPDVTLLPPVDSAPSTSWSTSLLCGWAAIAAVGLLLLARAVWRRHEELRRRTPVTDPSALRALERLRASAGIPHRILLTRCTGASSPVVLSRREICLPERADELAPEALQAVLAHELAHIERRDGLWLFGALLLQAVCWFQPLLRKACGELQESAELAADDRAVELTGDPIGLARTLTEVAAWAQFSPAPVVAMARAGSPIVQRVARLLEAADATPLPSRRRAPWCALAVLAALGAGAPSIAASESLAPLAYRAAPSAFIPIAAPIRAYPLRPSQELPSAPTLTPPVVLSAPKGAGVTPSPVARAGRVEPHPDPARADGDGARSSSARASADSDGPAADVARASAGPARARAGAVRARAEAARAAAAEARAPAAGSQPSPPPGVLPNADGRSVAPRVGDVWMNDVVTSVMRRAIAFSRSAVELAVVESRLRQQLLLAEHGLALRGVVAAAAKRELADLRRQLAEARSRRQRAEHELEHHMRSWGQNFEQRLVARLAMPYPGWQRFGIGPREGVEGQRERERRRGVAPSEP